MHGIVCFITYAFWSTVMVDRPDVKRARGKGAAIISTNTAWSKDEVVHKVFRTVANLQNKSNRKIRHYKRYCYALAHLYRQSPYGSENVICVYS